MAKDEFISVKEFAAMQSVEERTVRNWMRYDPPLPYRSSKKGVQVPVKRGIKWRVDYELKRHAAENAPNRSAAKKRLEEIKVEREEISLRRDKDELILAHVHRARVSKLAAHFAGIIRGQLARYANDVQLAETPVAARQVCERIRDDLLDALQRTADSIDEDPDPSEVVDDRPRTGAAA